MPHDKNKSINLPTWCKNLFTKFVMPLETLDLKTTSLLQPFFTNNVKTFSYKDREKKRVSSTHQPIFFCKILIYKDFFFRFSKIVHVVLPNFYFVKCISNCFCFQQQKKSSVMRKFCHIFARNILLIFLQIYS
jgi:hypothetical protein